DDQTTTCRAAGGAKRRSDTQGSAVAGKDGQRKAEGEQCRPACGRDAAERGSGRANPGAKQCHAESTEPTGAEPTGAEPTSDGRATGAHQYARSASRARRQSGETRDASASGSAAGGPEGTATTTGRTAKGSKASRAAAGRAGCSAGGTTTAGSG